MTRSRPPSPLPLPAVARAAGLGLLAASLLAGCVLVDGRGGPPPHAPAYGARPRSVVVLPPPVTVTPTLVVIAGTPVSYATNWPEDLFYYEGRYYRPYQGSWYWSVTVGGEWVQVSVGQVPRVVLQVPPDYREHRGGPPPWSHGRGRHGKGRHGHGGDDD